MVANLIIKAALTAAQIGLGMLRKIEGPRLDSRKFAGGQYNVPLARVWGTSWVAGNYDWGKDLIEVKRRRKTKGGKYNEYSYFGDFDVVLTCHEIAAVRRIKADGHLIYDRSGVGPVSPFDFGDAAGTIDDYIKVYLGAADQAVDGAIAADVDTRFGEGSTPAFRGYGRVRFHNLPLEKFGNRIPQIECEVQSLTSALGPTETVTVAYQASTFQFSNDFAFAVTGTVGGATWFDVAARQAFGAAAFDPALTYGGFGLEGDGTVLGLTGSLGSQLYSYEQTGFGIFSAAIAASTRLLTVTDADGGEHWLATNLYSGAASWFDGGEIDLTALIGGTWNAQFLFADAAGGVWLAASNSSTLSALFRRISGGIAETITVTGLAAAVGFIAPTVEGAVWYRDDSREQIVFQWQHTLYTLDRASGAVVDSRTGLASLPGPNGWLALRPGRVSVWCGLVEVSLADLATLRTEVAATWGLGSVGATIYDPINDALITFPTGFTVRWLYLNRLGDAAVTLATVVREVYALGGGNAAQIDVTALTQEIAGYQCSSGTGRDWIEPLLELYDIDARPHGFKLEFLPRGGAAGAAIGSDSFAMTDPGGATALFSSVAEGGSDVPAQVVLRFADLAADQQPNGAASPRLSELDGKRVLTLDMSTLALTGTDALQLVARLHRRRLFDAKTLAFGLTARQIALEPGDVRPLDLRGFSATARLHSLELGADRALRTEWRRDDPSVHLLDASAEGAGFDGRTPSVVLVPLLAQGFFLDIPYLADADERAAPTLYIAAGPLADGAFPGATAYQAVGGEYSEELATIESSGAATWGYASDVLPGCNPWLWDRSSVIEVVLQTGSLTSCTEAQCDADESRNQVWLGGELLQFTSATLTATRTYDLSGFKRGRRGTEWACASHAAGEKFLLLDTALDEGLGLSEVGTNLSFKAITAGRTTGFPVAVAPFTGASLKPYAPCQLAAVKNAGSGDWALTWVRRTRLGGAWTGGTPVPLSELSEEYEVEVMDGVTVKRTFAGLSAATVTYTAAQQTTDWGAPLASAPVFRVYQISDAVGRGFVALAA